MPQSAHRPRPPLSDPAILAATWFGSGYLPKAPGTWGTLAALPFAWIIQGQYGAQGLLIAAILVSALGFWSADVYMKQSGSHDPGAIVIDEVAGMWITLLPLSPDPMLYALGFVLFRVLDVLKPWPISLADKKIGGAFGVMFDDILAGGFGALVLYFLVQWLGVN